MKRLLFFLAAFTAWAVHGAYHVLEALGVTSPFPYFSDRLAIGRPAHEVMETLIGLALLVALVSAIRDRPLEAGNTMVTATFKSENVFSRVMPSFVALLKISGKTNHAIERLKNLPLLWKGVKTNSVIIGTGGYDAVVFFDAPDVTIGTEYISEHLRDNDPLTMIDVVTGEKLTLR